jgi:hypothetical protein
MLISYHNSTWHDNPEEDLYVNLHSCESIKTCINNRSNIDAQPNNGDCLDGQINNGDWLHNQMMEIA